jgi:plastocyanin
MTVFYVAGALLAIWALVLAAMGIARDRFPGGRGGERAVIAVSGVLVAAAIGSAVIGGALEEEEESEAAESEAAAPAPAETVAEEAPGAEELALGAEPSGDFSFDTAELEAPAGPITLAMENPSPVPHNVSVDGEGVNEVGETVETGGISTVSLELEAGEYLYYCSVPGHREGGMEGTLTVK